MTLRLSAAAYAPRLHAWSRLRTLLRVSITLRLRAHLLFQHFPSKYVISALFKFEWIIVELPGIQTGRVPFVHILSRLKLQAQKQVWGRCTSRTGNTNSTRPARERWGQGGPLWGRPTPQVGRALVGPTQLHPPPLDWFVLLNFLSPLHVSKFNSKVPIYLKMPKYLCF